MNQLNMTVYFIHFADRKT